MEQNPVQIALQAVTKAIEEDGKGNYQQALPWYKVAISHFTKAAEREENITLKQTIYVKMAEYSQRASVLAEFLEKEQSRLQQQQQPPQQRQPPPAYAAHHLQGASPSPSPPSSSNKDIHPTSSPTVSVHLSAPSTTTTPPGSAIGNASPAVLPKVLSFRWFNGSEPDNKIFVGIRRWHFKWSSNSAPVSSKYPFLRSTFACHAHYHAQQGVVIELKNHRVQRYSDNEQEWESPMGIQALKSLLLVDHQGRFVKALDAAGEEAKPDDLGASEGRSQWALWAERWLGLSVDTASRSEQETRKVESRMTHWKVPCLSLCEKTEHGGGDDSQGTFESIIEWASLRPHVCSETRWETSPDGTITLVKSLFVFDWRDILSSTEEFCQPSEYYDEIFRQEVEKEMDAVRAGKPPALATESYQSHNSTIGMAPVPGHPDEEDDLLSDEEGEIDITDPEERAALEREFEKLSWTEEDPPGSPGPSAPRIEEHKKDPPASASPLPQPTYTATVTATVPQTASTSKASVPEKEDPAVHVSSIPNKVLLAEILMLRRELRAMQQAQQNQTAEIAALKNLLLEVLKK